MPRTTRSTPYTAKDFVFVNYEDIRDLMKTFKDACKKNGVKLSLGEARYFENVNVSVARVNIISHSKANAAYKVTKAQSEISDWIDDREEAAQQKGEEPCGLWLLFKVRVTRWDWKHDRVDTRKQKGQAFKDWVESQQEHLWQEFWSWSDRQKQWFEQKFQRSTQRLAGWYRVDFEEAFQNWFNFHQEQERKRFVQLVKCPKKMSRMTFLYWLDNQQQRFQQWRESVEEHRQRSFQELVDERIKPHMHY